jgi:hypothetical protein
MSTQPAPTTRRPKLPFTLLILAGIMALKATVLVAIMLGAAITGIRAVLGMSYAPELLDAVRADVWSSAVVFVTGVLLLVSAIGLLRRRRTGWLLAMVLTGVFVAVDIYGFLNGGANHFWMALNIVTVFYLNQSDVREIVGATSTRAAGEAGAT